MSHSLILASTSRYRRELLQRLALPFEVKPSNAAETHRDGESPADRSARLAVDKARIVLAEEPEAIVIGSDQVADLDQQVMDKPGTVDAAVAQLQRSSGKCVTFHTAVCVLSSTRQHVHVDRTQVRFRQLDADEIRRYVAAEQPLDCAGSFKCEALGISLFESIESNDPTALVGLPLIALCELLRRHGLQLP